MPGWRKASEWKKKVKIEARVLQKVKSSGGKNKENRLRYATMEYLNLAKKLDEKVVEFIAIFIPSTVSQTKKLIELKFFESMLTKHIDLIERRLLNGEKIPHDEKVFSLFEPHTTWNSKGKAGVICELGQKHLVVTDQNNFIVFHKLIADIPDKHFTIEVALELKEKYGERLTSLSFDKGFSSKEIITELETIIPNAIIKQKGKPSNARKEIESLKEFKELNNKHSAVESNINQLGNNGLHKCRDKGEKNFTKYVSLGVLSYNLHRLGSLIKKSRLKEKPKNRSRAA